MYRKLIALSLAFFPLCSLAHAAPITYTVTDTASGTIGAKSFSNQAISVVFTGDTANVVNSGGFSRTLLVSAPSLSPAWAHSPLPIRLSSSRTKAW